MEKRGPRKIKVDYGRPDMYKAFIKENKKDSISSSIYSKVLNDFNKGISKEILENAYEFVLPQRLGIIRIKKYKQKVKIDNQGNLDTSNLSPNWKATNELWAKNAEAKKQKKRLFHTNEHSDGYQYKWHFSNYRSVCVNKSAYCFVPSRDNKRAITVLVTDEDFNGDFYM